MTWHPAIRLLNLTKSYQLLQHSLQNTGTHWNTLIKNQKSKSWIILSQYNWKKTWDLKNIWGYLRIWYHYNLTSWMDGIHGPGTRSITSARPAPKHAFCNFSSRSSRAVRASRKIRRSRTPSSWDGWHLSTIEYHRFTIVHSKSLTSSLTKLKPFKIHICKCQG